jgi:alpha-tubulin suppressor-like RCC1 family protein
LKNDGSVVAWGSNGSGQTNVPVAAQSGVMAIAAGVAHTVALKNDGSVVAWGGTGPVPAGLSGVTAIAAGGALLTVALIGTAPLLPSLTARPNGYELILSWSTNAAGFTLQSTANLTSPVTWIDSTNPPAVIGAQFTVTNTHSGPAQFYRLRKL